MSRANLCQEVKKYKSTTELAILLGWFYEDWHGTLTKKLMTASELKIRRLVELYGVLEDRRNTQRS
ncbi:hypothetical protein GCK32_020835, partial [Trichostrongylus colubriformis]